MLILLCVAALFCLPSSRYRPVERPLCLRAALFFSLVMQSILSPKKPCICCFLTSPCFHFTVGWMSMLSFKPLIKMKDRPCRIFYQQHIFPTWQQINCASPSILDKVIQTFSRILVVVVSTNILMATSATVNWVILRFPQRSNIYWSFKEPVRVRFPFRWRERTSAMFLYHTCWMPTLAEIAPIRIVFLAEGHNYRPNLPWHGMFAKRKRSVVTFKSAKQRPTSFVHWNGLLFSFLCLLLWKSGRVVELGEVTVELRKVLSGVRTYPDNRIWYLRGLVLFFASELLVSFNWGMPQIF